VKAVFDVREGSGYDDSIGRYHFPARSDYLEAAHDAVGDLCGELSELRFGKRPGSRLARG
jgi:hypothetical protein